MLHSVEIARAAGIDLWSEVLSQANSTIFRVGFRSGQHEALWLLLMPDIEAKGGIR